MTGKAYDVKDLALDVSAPVKSLPELRELDLNSVKVLSLGAGALAHSPLEPY